MFVLCNFSFFPLFTHSCNSSSLLSAMHLQSACYMIVKWLIINSKSQWINCVTKLQINKQNNKGNSNKKEMKIIYRAIRMRGLRAKKLLSFIVNLGVSQVFFFCGLRRVLRHGCHAKRCDFNRFEL